MALVFVFVLSCLGPAPFAFVVFVLSLSCLRFVLSCLGLVLVLSLLLSCPVLRRAVCFVLFCLVLFWSSSGSFGVIFGCRRGRFGSFLVVLGVVLALLGRLGGLLGHLGAVLGAVDGG